MRYLRSALFCLFFASFVCGASFEEDAALLVGASSFGEKEQAIAALSQYVDDPRLKTLLQSLLDGALYKYENRLVCSIGGAAFDALDNAPFAGATERLTKIAINNRIRGLLRAELVAINLGSNEKSTRLNAAKELLGNLQERDAELIEAALLNEQDEDARYLLLQAQTILEAKTAQEGDRLLAIRALGAYASPYALQALYEMRADPQSAHLEAIDASIDRIENVKRFYGVLETLFFGLSAGSVLLLAAIGLAITFGVMKVINMAHGELIMLGAYTTYAIQQFLPNLVEYSVLIAIPAAFLVSAAVGIAIERLALRYLYARPLEALLATFGISLILQQLVRTIFSEQNRDVKTPDWLSGSFEVSSFLSLTYNRFFILIFSLLVFACVALMMKKTSLGLKVRAISQNRPMAQAMGVKTGYVDALTFGVGSGIAGIAGVALSQLTNVGPNLGQAYIVDSFMVVVFGGVGNLFGALVGAFALGEFGKILEPFSGPMLAKILLLVFVILFIQKRPSGLFPKKGRDAEE
jgi:urea transport system permease protein